MISYADFVTLLFAFFTTMYAISQVDSGKLALFAGSMRSAFRSVEGAASRQIIEGVRPVPRDLVDIGSELTRALRDFPAEDVSVTTDDRGVVVSLGDRIVFEPGQSAIRESAFPAMDAVAAVIRGIPNKVVIEGHTDNVPISGPRSRYGSNWELSTARAVSVLEYFLSRHRIPPSRLSASGYAEFRPVASNTSPEGRARNRRVSVVIQTSPLL